MDTKGLLAKARAAAGIKSNYALAKLLGITETALSNYELGKRHPEPYIASLIATAAGMKPEAGIAICELDRAKSPAERKHWKMRICVDCPFETKQCAKRPCTNKQYASPR